MLEAPIPRWMKKQIDRDLQNMATAEHPGLPWPQKDVLHYFTGFKDGPMPEQKRFCVYHISKGQVRHCNFTERGYHSRNYARARIMARAMTVLSDRKLLPEKDVSFVFSHSDIEWEDLALPVLSFQRARKPAASSAFQCGNSSMAPGHVRWSKWC